ncbi:MAG TPA: hypothetical protein PKW15_00575 [Alphaproteobacteria bacterium]|mgnify:CR=1 FL=1|nr:hypothetical protein [Rhodospirillaceae bacterium]HRJ11717.1 hypothetical protein [Alphaproteobacteria bacterium]
MSITRTVKTNFTAGEVSPLLLGRGDLRAYDNGALLLRNVFIYPTGGITRRAGLEYLAQLPGTGRLASLEFNAEQNYLLVFTNELLSIFLDGVLVETLATPWISAQLNQINWTQSADTLLVVHPDVEPQRIMRTNAGWTIAAWEFFTDANIIHQPYYKFADTAVTVTPSATSGTITLTASASVFENGLLNTRMRVHNKEVDVIEVQSATVVRVTTIENLPDTNPTIDWQEQSFSSVRGWPTAVAFHQNRLVIGGSRDLPNRLWLSKSGNLFNFNLGTAQDDEAIEFGILSDQVNAIRGLFSSRHLQIFTSGAEWMVTGTPLTPASIQLNRQTRVGTLTERTVPPVDVEGGTLFVSRSGNEVREFIYSDLEQAYTATDLALLAQHMILSPQSLAYDKTRRTLFLVRGDGTFATLTLYRAEAVVAWTSHETDGQVLSMAVVGDKTYALIDRGGDYFLESFNDAFALDSALSGTAGSPATTWYGLEHLEGRIVSIVADGKVQPDQTVTSGMIVLENAANNIVVGLPFAHQIEPLPPNAVGPDGAGRCARLIETQFRLQNSYALRLDIGMGLRDISLRRHLNQTTIGAAPPRFDGDLTVRGIGWAKDLTQPLWKISGFAPLPFTLLSVSATININ